MIFTEVSSFLLKLHQYFLILSDFFFHNDFKVFCFVLFFATVNFLIVTKANFPGSTSTKSTFHQEDVIFHPFFGNIKFYHVQF